MTLDHWHGGLDPVAMSDQKRHLLIRHKLRSAGGVTDCRTKILNNQRKRLYQRNQGQAGGLNAGLKPNRSGRMWNLAH